MTTLIIVAVITVIGAVYALVSRPAQRIPRGRRGTVQAVPEVGPG